MQNTPTPQKSSTRAAAGAGIVFVSQIAGYGLYFLAQRVVLSSMSKDDFGALSYVQLMCSLFLTIFVDAGMNTIALREMIAKPETKRDVVSSVLWLRIMAIAFSALVLASYTVLFGTESWVVVLLAVFMISMSSRSSMLRAAIELPYRERLQLSAVSLSFIADWCLYLILLYTFRAELSPTLIFSLQLLSSLPATLFLSWKTRVDRILFPLPSLVFLKNLIRQIVPQTSQLVLQNVHGVLDLYLVRLFAPIREIGVINAVANMGQIILTAFLALSSTLYPMIAEAIHQGKDNAVHRIERTLSVIVFVAIILATCLSTLSPFIAFVFTKNVYADNIIQFQLQFWLAVVTCIAQTALLINAAQNEHRAMFFSGLFLVVGSLSADFLLIPEYMSSGYILAKTWSNILSAAVSLWFVGRSFGFSLIRKFSFRTLALTAICLPYSLLILRYWSQPLACAGGVLLCSVSAAALGFLTKDEWALTQKLARKIAVLLRLRSSAQV